MKVAYKDSLEYRIKSFIKHNKSSVLLREDIGDFGSYRQISRVLKKLQDNGDLVKIGYGIYAKAYKSEYIAYPLIEDGFELAAREALDRLGIDWTLSKDEKAYNDGTSQQVPLSNAVRLKSRCRRKISYQNKKLLFEGNVNAR